jgi:hypothetical protein
MEAALRKILAAKSKGGLFVVGRAGAIDFGGAKAASQVALPVPLVVGLAGLWRWGFDRCQSIFGIHAVFFRALKGGFFLKERPPGCEFSVYSNSENA